MNGWWWLAGAAGMLAAAGAGGSVLGARRWARAMQRRSGQLEAASAQRPALPAGAARYDPHELEGLPAPVQRYFRAVLTEGQPMIAAATLGLAGRINLSATGERWQPFTSRQRIVTWRPGFLWDARVALAPGLHVRVVDGYIAGQGLLRAAVQGLVAVAEQHGGGEIARGEFMRWFAEAAWVPTALLPSQGVRWTAVDEDAALATLVDGPLSLTLLFRFNEAGLISSARAEARGAMVGRKMVMHPWEGCWSDYQRRGGMTLPMKGEAAWLPPTGRRAYFVGTVTAMDHEFRR